jgi:hypothetical protein
VTEHRRPAVLVDVLLIDGRVASSEMLQRMRTLALAGGALREVVSGERAHSDTHFDPDFHVRLETLPDPRSVRELKRLASRLIEEPFAEQRPGWTLHYVEKVARNRSALIVRRLAAFDERLVGALTGNPTSPTASGASSGFDFTSLLGAAQRLLMQPDPMNALIDRGATIAAKVMQELEKPEGRRSGLWSHRSGSLDHQDLRLDRLVIQRAATNLSADERAIILALLADTAARLHRSAPIDTLQCGVATRRRDVSRLVAVSLPTSEMSFQERVLAIQELLIHLPQPSTSATTKPFDFGEWVPPALTALIDERRTNSIDLACVFAEPIGPLTGIGVNHGTVLPLVSLLGAAVSVIATVEGNFVRLGFSVDKGCGMSIEELRLAYQESARAHIGALHEGNVFSRWWAALRRPSTTA